MSCFTGKKVVLGVTGGIAAYKAVEIASRLKKLGADVYVIMTQGAQNFITPLTFREITGNPVACTMWGEVANHHVEHIALATMADFVLVAPATANLLAKLAVGIADDLLTTTILATKSPVFLAPAMNTGMYANPITQKNIDSLKNVGMIIIPPGEGILACGINGIGRLPEPIEIIQFLDTHYENGDLLAGKRILVTAAGTIEPIDPVRYIGNRSSGKMGYAIAEEAARLGANVILISGPSALPDPRNCETIRIETAQEMYNVVMEQFDAIDIVIKAAAVADYRVKHIASQKIKKGQDSWSLELERNPDILYALGQRKQHQLLVGFAAETQNVIDYAKGKLQKKNLDLIVANDVSQVDAGFNTETNRVHIITRNGVATDYPLMSKQELARIILRRVSDLMLKRRYDS